VRKSSTDYKHLIDEARRCTENGYNTMIIDCATVQDMVKSIEFLKETLEFETKRNENIAVHYSSIIRHLHQMEKIG